MREVALRVLRALRTLILKSPTMKIILTSILSEHYPDATKDGGETETLKSERLWIACGRLDTYG
jgi:hypothetical protein